MVFEQHDTFTTRTSTFVRSRLATAALALSISLAGGATVAAQQGQDATPTSGGAVTCAAPNVATPAAGASPVASPAADATSGTTVEDQAIIDELTAVVTECAPEGATDVQVLAVSDYGNGSYGVDYQFLTGKQVMRMLDVYSNESGTWTLTGQTPQSPETDEDSITVSVKFGAEAGVIELSPAEFGQLPAVKFHANNQASDAMTFALYTGTADFDPASVTGQDMTAVEGTLQAPVATAAVPGTTELDVLLEGLEQGTYVIVIYDASGAADSAAVVTVAEPLVLDVPNVLGTPEASPAS